MALIKCEECGKEISDKASTCPSCGSPTFAYQQAQKGKEENIKVIAFFGGLVVLISLVGAYAISCSRNNPTGFSSDKFLGSLECPYQKSNW
tara:strand:+ start:231 stop:503 length:273 start_codon:yes stop_codon:yes gene_type:complete